jgi:hypothetical protein
MSTVLRMHMCRVVGRVVSHTHVLEEERGHREPNLLVVVGFELLHQPQRLFITHPSQWLI